MSNTTDAYVPALSRHVFTEGGCSDGTHSQPCFNETAGAFTETWDGYIYVPEAMENVKLKVSADDNACFYLHAFSEYKADLLGRGPLGGGNYSSAESTPIPMLKKGYYRVHVSYTNIDYPGKNLARLNVLLNDEQITIGQLETHNTLSEEEATLILSEYMEHVDYTKTQQEIWALFGELALKECGDKNTCATRVSIALSRSGYTLTGAMTSDGKPASNNVVKLGWDAQILNADGSDTKRHIVMSAYAMSQLYHVFWGNSDYDICSDYQNDSKTDLPEVYNPHPGDIVIFGDASHVGICPGNEPSVAYFMSGAVWLLYRPTWGDPV